jgi:2-polyprenyl-6-methoxyphenol hydroxylase-like FAD-dependent oxidoreductase
MSPQTPPKAFIVGGGFAGIAAAKALAGAPVELRVVDRRNHHVPEEDNILLNPDHADFALIKIGRASTFSFDTRMWKHTP